MRWLGSVRRSEADTVGKRIISTGREPLINTVSPTGIAWWVLSAPTHSTDTKKHI